MKRGKLVLLVTLMASPAWAAEYAVVASGFRILVERHETGTATVTLFTNGGSVQVPREMIVGFEPADTPSSKPAAGGSAAPSVGQPPSPQDGEADSSLHAAPAPAPQAATLKELVSEAASRHGLPAEFVHSLAAVESSYRPDALSSKGAIGVMQLMPQTAVDLQADPFDARENIEAGVRYLRDLLLRYQDHPDQVRRALAAYNAGPGAVERYGGVPPYRETVEYIRKVIRKYQQARRPSW